MRGIYVHVPFCVRKCGYCDFYSVAGGEEERDRSPGRVEREMDLLLRKFPGEASVPADTVYFGGGTPTVLGPDRLNRLLAAIRSRFPAADDAEITTEANPGTVTGDDFSLLREGGFNRVSLGVQSFLPETLAALGRIHSVGDVRAAYRDACRAGFSSVGIDLIFGNPGQNEAEWQEDLDLAVTFLPDHVSAYALTPEPGTPIHAAIGGGEIALPDDDTVARMYTAARETLWAAGYRHYEISNFARPGFESRHNLKYWKLEPYIGFGADAHSFDGRKRHQNPESIEDYLSGAGQVPDVAHLSDERFFIGLRLSAGIRPAPEEWRRFDAPIHRFLDAGLLETDGATLRLTRRGVLLSNEVFQEFLNL